MISSNSKVSKMKVVQFFVLLMILVESFQELPKQYEEVGINTEPVRIIRTIGEISRQSKLTN